MAVMQLSDYSYDLPERLIAKHPPKVRGSSRLLVLHRDSGNIEHRYYYDLAEYLAPEDLVVRNNTQVIKARIHAVNQNGAHREILLLESHGADDRFRHKVLHRGKLRPGDLLDVGPHQLKVDHVIGNGEAVISSETSLYDIANQYGKMPLPPYMHRDATVQDSKRYQTVFAQKAGSVAAPTASLNFTHDLESKLNYKNIHIAELTLHVGLGTFLPIRTNILEKHIMHSEYFVVPKSTIMAINRTKNRGNKVLSVGTTVTRTLEYCAPQMTTEQNHDLSGEADIFIYPGYNFQVVDALLTNFHAPKSTVLMMAAAFAGWDNLKRAYEEAIKDGYAFLSYGDSMLII